MSETKALVFRVSTPLKQAFRIALMEQGLNIQQTMEAFLESFVDHCKGKKDAKSIETIIKRAKSLTDEGLN